jgi:hypothetical protein
MTRALVAAALLLLVATAAGADVFRPAYLELRQLDAERWDVTWKVPARGGEAPLAIDVELPAGVEWLVPRRGVVRGGAWVERFQIRRAGGLDGQAIAIHGLDAGVTDAIARVERLDGSSQLERLGNGGGRFVVAPPLGRLEVARSYVALGVAHILGGLDHLLFELALLLIVRGTGRVATTVTAFTLAHSVSLAAATLGFVRVPQPPVDAAIALSIVFVAAEIVHGLRGSPGLTARAPWTVAFGFGLLHGLGFASALAEAGLPEHAIPLALVCFNVGVEIGQLCFVAAIAPLVALVRRVSAPWPRWLDAVPAYAIGSVAMLWLIERVGDFASY